ncbi:MAG: nucleotidyl transferase AbiEii/AbiGii toxin family protein [Elusimicrobia bacterium]|nr:nucleotidyl transferase AbiEii/AbiGii toxin family protein [Elusimicrobiota bacterium]
MNLKGNPYFNQAQFMMRLVPFVAAEDCFALKGGTAINFFVWDMPRLSVDIDLTYLPLQPREESLVGISEALVRIKTKIAKALPGVVAQEGRVDGRVAKLLVRGTEGLIKIEPNFVIRGAVQVPLERDLCPKAREEFGMSVGIKTLANADLFGGKICAALDRQHPRDFFDIKILLENEGITPEIRKAFIVYLVSHDRPIHEVIDPPRKDFRDIFETNFVGMEVVAVTYDELMKTRERLIAQLKKDMTREEKEFIIAIKEGKPKWDLLGIEGLEKLPAIQWKLRNINKIDRTKHKESIAKLKTKLEI